MNISSRVSPHIMLKDRPRLAASEKRKGHAQGNEHDAESEHGDSGACSSKNCIDKAKMKRDLEYKDDPEKNAAFTS